MAGVQEPVAVIDDEDLEDGEIESDGDEATPAEVAKTAPSLPLLPVAVTVVTTKATNERPSEPSPPKKSRHSSKPINEPEEDFATNLERQLAQALGKPTPSSPAVQSEENSKRPKEDRSKDKNRKRRRRNESPDREKDRDKSRKKKSRGDAEGGEKVPADENDMDDDYEMMNVRGGSPPPSGAAVGGTPSAGPPSDGNASDRSYSSYDSYDSADYHRRQRRRNRAAERSNRREARRRDKDQEKRRARVEGNTNRHHRDGNDSERDVGEYKNHPRKMELCKFYLMECCAKREKCLYMHQDFPCKYYYTGSECTVKDCKFAHGKPLTDALRAILMKHLETAPKEILGDFPRLGRELANQKIRSRHKELCAKFNIADETSAAHSNGNNNNTNNEKSGQDLAHIPPLNDIYSKPPPPIRGKMNDDRSRGNFDKNRKSRWCEQMRNDGAPMTGANAIPVATFAKGAGPSSLLGATSNVSEKAKMAMSLQNLTNVLTQDQITKLAAIGIETLDQVKHLTVLQLTEIGLSISQLSEIQKSAMDVEKITSIGGSGGTHADKEKRAEIAEPEKMNSAAAAAVEVRPTIIVGDTDMRMVPTVSQDVDMRFLGLPPTTVPIVPTVPLRLEIASPDAAEDRMEPNAVMDYSQYLREANLVEDSAGTSRDAVEEKTMSLGNTIGQEPMAAEQREENEAEDEDDDDDESKLKICNDEDDEEEEKERNDSELDTDSYQDKSEAKEQKEDPLMIPSVSYWPLNLASLTSLNKIDLSSSVTQMMNAEKNEQQQQQQQPPPVSKIDAFVSMYSRMDDTIEDQIDDESSSQSREPNRDSDSENKRAVLDPRDPRNRDPRNSREPPKSPPLRQPQVIIRPSIYDCSDGEESSEDSPPPKPDQDMRVSAFFGDSNELANRDIDLRLPFKPMLQNYVPATEIDGSISSHLPMNYKVVEWDVPKPNFRDIRRRVSVENSQDPRLKRIFGLEGEAKEADKTSTNEDAERSLPPNTHPRISADPRMDPRRRKEALLQTPAAGLDIQIVLQKSAWYTDLGSKNKIFVNQQLAVLTSELKRHHEEVLVAGPKPFEVSKVYEHSPMLMNVLQQLSVLVDDQGHIQPLVPAMGVPPPQMGNVNDPNMLMPELAAMIQQQQSMNNPGMQGMFNNMNPAMIAGHAMQQPPQQMGIRPGLLGMPPNLGFPGPQQQPGQFDDFGGNMQGGGAYRMNYNENMGGGGGGFFQQQQGPPMNRMMMMNNNNRGNFRNNNNNSRNDRWVQNNNNRGGNDGRRHNSRRD